MNSNRKHIVPLTLLAVFISSPVIDAQILQYPNPCLDYVYPAGGQRGQAVTVELGSVGGIENAKSIVIDGPPGIMVKDFKSVSGSLAQATFVIAPDAPLGRRFVRVAGGTNGLTNFRYFFVGNLAEVVEKEGKEGNNTLASAQEVPTPAVVNGRIDKDLDIDCFRFAAKAGERLVVAAVAHRMDSIVRARFNEGFVDLSLELLDEQGNILAAADDTFGLDPALTHTFKSAGRYIVRLQSLTFKGSLSSVYRLTIGDVPHPTHVFPAGGQQGKDIEVDVGGLLFPEPNGRKFNIPSGGTSPLCFLPPTKKLSSGHDLPLLRGEFPEARESEPNDDAKRASTVPLPLVVNGRFAKKGDEDWYRVTLKKGRPTVFEVAAQRYFYAPLDTVLEIYDAAGKKLAENDDGQLFAHPNYCTADFSAPDSWLAFTPPADGDYFLRLRDQTGASGPRAIYRLTMQDSLPAFGMYQWPDAVPIWGPGTTAAFVVEVFRWGYKDDVELRIEGLPKGWTGSSVKVSGSSFQYQVPSQAHRVLLTITAPPDAVPGVPVPFRVIGKYEFDGKTQEREVNYLTLYGNAHNDRMFLRASPGAYAVVAGYMDAWPEISIKELTVTHGDTVQIPVRMHRKPGDKRGPIGVVVNGMSIGVNCAYGVARTMKADEDMLTIPLKIEAQIPEGTRGVVVSRSWSSDLRGGRPGPCTPLILLHVKAKGK